MILLIDNYDSFVYNVYQALGSLCSDIVVYRNDAITLEEIEAMAPSHIVLSPGPGTPAEAGICADVVRHFQGKIPILGICLGHQVMGEVYGAMVGRAPEIVHGKGARIRITGESPLFKGLGPIIEGARYHSLAIDPKTVTSEFRVVAETETDGIIMAIAHKEYPVYGLQFHPESILTPQGMVILQNFLDIVGVHRKDMNNKLVKEALGRVVEGKDLTTPESDAVMRAIMSGDVSESLMAALLVALRMKGETIPEITGFTTAMRTLATPVTHEGTVFEIVGTGGDGANTFNISTTAGFVIAAGGVPVAKHGNRSVSSACGAADCLEALGAQIMLRPDQTEQLLTDVGFAFMFAPLYHSSMKHAVPVRKMLGLRTVFNVLGPLSNPAGATEQLMGVFDKKYVEPLANVLVNVGVTRGAVVHGFDGLDEMTACDKTYVCEIKDGECQSYVFDPKEYGYDYAMPEELVGGDATVNAEITRAVLGGERSGRRTAVVINSGYSLYLAGKASTIEAGLALAEELIDSGKALALLEAYCQRSQALSEVAL